MDCSTIIIPNDLTLLAIISNCYLFSEDNHNIGLLEQFGDNPENNWWFIIICVFKQLFSGMPNFQIQPLDDTRLIMILTVLPINEWLILVRIGHLLILYSHQDKSLMSAKLTYFSIKCLFPLCVLDIFRPAQDFCGKTHQSWDQQKGATGVQNVHSLETTTCSCLAIF